MMPFKFKNVCIESYATNLPNKKITSAEMEESLAPLYERLKIPLGTFEKLTGVSSRYFWEDSVLPSQVSTVAAHKALEHITFPKENLQAVFSCSITRDYFEPATACLVHSNLGLREDSIALDISNACLGFMSGLQMMGTLIESGAIKAGVVVSGECMQRPMAACQRHLRNDENISRDDLIKFLPTLTLGAGSVAYVLAHSSIASPTAHKILGGVTNSATQYHDLCVGNGDYVLTQGTEFNPLMTTESTKLIQAAAELGGRSWQQASEVLGWDADDIDHIFCHQVGKQVNEAFYKTMALDMQKEYTIYKTYGNLASAAVPTALILGAQEKNIQPKEKVLLTGFGSGLNSLFMGIEW